MSPLAEFLKSLRLAHCLSQTQFGLPMGLAGSHICIIEKGLRYAPEIGSLQPLIGEFNLSPDDEAELIAAAEVSPRKLRIHPNSPSSAFRLVAALEKRWLDFSEEEFRLLHLHVETLTFSPSK